ncbi:MAG: hypothetical protein QOH49_468 [Acidobacteriota bacterium]|jgi:hypothetical protein|nr:hypothetical protein [Acidobacteriota bacterium]
MCSLSSPQQTRGGYIQHPPCWLKYIRTSETGCAQLNGAYLNRATLAKAYLGDADLSRACLKYVNLTEANLGRANLFEADLSGADFTGANLSGADLIKTTLIETRFQGANLTGCKVFGVAAWKVNLDRAKQQNLTITADDEPTITVDNLEVAQFIYLLLNNHKIRDVIDSITSKAVLILGRFTPGRKIVLDLLREELRKYNYLPIVFDFDKPASRNLTETVSTLAHMARFVIADITDAKSIPQELQRIVPHLPSLPVQPLILSSQYEYGMFKDFLDYPWVLAPYRYDSIKRLLPALSERVIVPAITKAKEIEDKHKDLEKR